MKVNQLHKRVLLLILYIYNYISILTIYNTLIFEYIVKLNCLKYMHIELKNTLPSNLRLLLNTNQYKTYIFTRIKVRADRKCYFL